MTLLWYFVSMLASKFNHLVTCTLWVSIIALTLVLGCYLLDVSYQRIDASHQELHILRYERYRIYKYYFCWSFICNLASKDWPVGNMCRSGLTIWLWLQYLLGSLLMYHNKVSMPYISNCVYLYTKGIAYTSDPFMIFLLAC